MKTRAFGNLLVLIGVFLAFLMFSLSEWRGGDQGVIWNIRYAEVTSFGCEGSSYLKNCALTVRLGHGLAFSLFVAMVGLAITREIISHAFLEKNIPFLTSADE